MEMLLSAIVASFRFETLVPENLLYGDAIVRLSSFLFWKSFEMKYQKV